MRRLPCILARWRRSSASFSVSASLRCSRSLSRAALRTHAKYLRIRMRQSAQERARKVTVKLIFPVFFLIFPSVLLVTLGPAVMHMVKSFEQFMR